MVARRSGGLPSRAKQLREPPLATHYETLGVRSDASAAQIRQAYLELARELHPDRRGGTNAAEAADTTRRMQAVNEAWHALSDPGRRVRYDASLDGVRTRGPSRPTAPARPRVVVDDEGDIYRYHSAGGWPMLVRGLPWLLVFGTLAAIFVFTAFATTDRSGPTTTTEPPPRVRAEAGECFALTEQFVLPVPCTDPGAQGVVASWVSLGATCGAGELSTYRQRERQTLCYTEL